MHSDSRGVTVVEILATIAVFALVIPSLYGSVVFLNILNRRAELLTQMNVLAENKLESLRSQGYNTVAVGITDFTTELPSNYQDPKSAQYDVTEVDGLKTVEVQLTVTDRGKTYTHTYSSIIGELGVAQ